MQGIKFEPQSFEFEFEFEFNFKFEFEFELNLNWIYGWSFRSFLKAYSRKVKQENENSQRKMYCPSFSKSLKTLTKEKPKNSINTISCPKPMVPKFLHSIYKQMVNKNVNNWFNPLCIRSKYPAYIHECCCSLRGFQEQVL